MEMEEAIRRAMLEREKQNNNLIARAGRMLELWLLVVLFVPIMLIRKFVGWLVE